MHREFTADCDGCSATYGFDQLMDTHFGRRLLVGDRSLDGALAAAAERRLAKVEYDGQH